MSKSPELYYSRCPHNTRERERSVERGHAVYSSPKCDMVNVAVGITSPKGKLHIECKTCGKLYFAYPKSKEMVVK